MDTDTRNAIRETYLFTFDAFAVGSPIELVDAEIAHNPRHARELLGTLVNMNLVTHSLVNGEDDAWQTVQTYDDITREQAESSIDKILAQYDTTTPTASPTKEKNTMKAPTTTKPATPTKAIEFKHCLCGCGENVPPKSNYRPGHDARHAGALAREWIALGGIDDETLQTLPTEALRDKAMAIYDRQADKAKAKADAAAAKAAKVDVDASDPEPEPVAEVAKPKAPARKRTAKKVTASA
jgi:hypothetical protein